MVAMTLDIETSPSGVIPMNGCSFASMPEAFSCSMMYLRVSTIAGVPDGRGPKPTCFCRCPHAFALSNVTLGAICASFAGATALSSVGAILLSLVGAIAFAVSLQPMARTENAPTRNAARTDER